MFIRHIFILEPTPAVRRLLVPALKQVAQVDCFRSFEHLAEVLETGFLPQVMFLPMYIPVDDHIHLLFLRLQNQHASNAYAHLIYFSRPLSPGHIVYQLPKGVARVLEPYIGFRLEGPYRYRLGK